MNKEVSMLRFRKTLDIGYVAVLCQKRQKKAVAKKAIDQNNYIRQCQLAGCGPDADLYF